MFSYIHVCVACGGMPVKVNLIRINEITRRSLSESKFVQEDS